MIPGHEFINFAMTPKLYRVLVTICRKHERVSYFWEANEIRDSMISLLKMAVGPREWSPRHGKVSFPVITPVEAGELLHITALSEDGTALEWDIGLVPQSGVVAVLPSPEEVKNQLTS